MANRAYEVRDIKGEEEKSWVKFRRFATSYKKAFQTLIEKEISEGSLGHNYDDEDILPALQLLHHYIELSLKSLLEKIGKNLQIHNLKKLLIEVEMTYPDFKLSSLSRSLVMGDEEINEDRPLLDFEGFRYPKDIRGKNIWVTKDEGYGSLINLAGVSTHSHQLISEIEEYFNKNIKLPVKSFHTSNKKS